MNAEKRRKSRVQGGWAGAGSKQNNASKPKQSVLASHASSQSPVTGIVTQRQVLASAQSHSVKLSESSIPQWTDNNIGQKSQNSQQLVFEDPEQEIQVKPADLTIVKSGTYDISTEPSGVSRLRYFPDFIEPSRSEAIFAELLDEIPWKQRSEVHGGVRAVQPRLTAWYNELPYTYAGITVEANTSEWPNALKTLKDQLVEVTGIEFNSLAANLYRDGHDSIGWHSDDEPIMGKNPTIVSLSFGEEGVFELRKKPPPNESGERDYTYSQVIKIPLRSGSLLIMEGWTQSDWQHRIPNEYHDRGARINITFRVAIPSHK
ncbi:unnamed protein product [Candidula unifasciata]|uniref:Fe2OG dioxygenase domain-containing protein n=1 Tax=Candidula unifasciata TaxID=100452 RepID=A0A8S3YRS4_9EUPU|nr:unnamed protein product [Candidula unifasciata]